LRHNRYDAEEVRRWTASFAQSDITDPDRWS
jgi:hypothetical protein